MESGNLISSLSRHFKYSQIESAGNSVSLLSWHINCLQLDRFSGNSINLLFLQCKILHKGISGNLTSWFSMQYSFVQLLSGGNEVNLLKEQDKVWQLGMFGNLVISKRSQDKLVQFGSTDTSFVKKSLKTFPTIGFEFGVGSSNLRCKDLQDLIFSLILLRNSFKFPV